MVAIKPGIGRLLRGLVGADDFTAFVELAVREQAAPATVSGLTRSGANWRADYPALTATLGRVRIDSQPVNRPPVQRKALTPGFLIEPEGWMVAADWSLVPPNSLPVYGTCEASNVYGRRHYTLSVNRSCGYRFRVISFPEGSLSHHIQTAVAAIVEGETPGASSQLLYSTNNYNSAAPLAVRNTANMVGAYDYSGISLVNGVSNKGRQGLLIGPRHIIGANHFFTESPVVWMTVDGSSYVTANIVSSQQIGTTDIRVGYLDREVNGVTPFKTLPANYLDFLPTLSKADYDYNLVTHPQTDATFYPDELAVLHNLPIVSIATNLPWGGTGCAFELTDFTSIAIMPMTNLWKDPELAGRIIDTIPSEAQGYDQWTRTVISGDSGGGLFMPINGELVLVSSYHTSASSPNFVFYSNEIDAAMQNLAALAGDPAASTYTTTPVDLSGFTSYA